MKCVPAIAFLQPFDFALDEGDNPCYHWNSRVWRTGREWTRLIGGVGGDLFDEQETMDLVLSGLAVEFGDDVSNSGQAHSSVLVQGCCSGLSSVGDVPQDERDRGRRRAAALSGMAWDSGAHAMGPSRLPTMAWPLPLTVPGCLRTTSAHGSPQAPGLPFPSTTPTAVSSTL